MTITIVTPGASLAAIALAFVLLSPGSAGARSEPQVTTYQGDLEAVSAVAADDAWAVGYGDGPDYTGILHWNGHVWKPAVTPTCFDGFGLAGVSATSATDAWAVGVCNDVQGSRAATLHWDGSSWAEVSTPLGAGSQVMAVSAVSPTEAWAIGEDVTHVGVLMRWDGSSWTFVPPPEPPLRVVTYHVSAAGASDVWVDALTSTKPTGNVKRAALLHWDGVSWTTYPAPAVERHDVIAGIAAFSRTDVWAAGNGISGGFVLHEDGTEPVKQVLGPGYSRGPFLGIGGSSAQDLWIVGLDRNRTPVALHRTGGGWTYEPTGQPGDAENALISVDAVDADDAWAVGYLSDGHSTETVLLHWDGTGWTRY